MSEETFAELLDVINRPKLQKYIDPEIKEAFIKSTIKNVEILKIEPFITACRDPKDNKFLDISVFWFFLVGGGLFLGLEIYRSHYLGLQV